MDEYDAMIYIWVRTSECEKGLDSVLFETVSKWIERMWLFENVFYPGKE